MMHKIAKWVGITFVVLAVVAACIYAVSVYKNRPQKVTTFLTVSLGASMDEVAYSLGVPTEVLKPSPTTLKDGTVAQWAEEVSKEEMAGERTTYKDYFRWHYDSDYFRTDVKFDPATKTVIEIGCYASEKQRPVAYCTVNEIGPGMKEDRVIDRLGPPSSSSIDQLVKRLEYANFNMVIYLEKREAYYIIVKDMSNQR
jgi:hypothetical protein